MSLLPAMAPGKPSARLHSTSHATMLCLVLVSGALPAASRWTDFCTGGRPIKYSKSLLRVDGFFRYTTRRPFRTFASCRRIDFTRHQQMLNMQLVFTISRLCGHALDTNQIQGALGQHLDKVFNLQEVFQDDRRPVKDCIDGCLLRKGAHAPKHVGANKVLQPPSALGNRQPTFLHHRVARHHSARI